MKIVKYNITTHKERLLAEAPDLPSAKSLQKAFLKLLYDKNEYNDYIIEIK